MALYLQRAAGILRLLKLIVRQHPVLTLLWLLVPLLSGLIIIPLANAERHLIDTAIGYVGHDRSGILHAAWPALIMLAAASVGAVILSMMKKLTDTYMANRAARHLFTEIQNRAIHAPLEQLETPEYYDRMSRAQSAADQALTSILFAAAETVRLTCSLVGMIVVVAAGHWSIAALLLFVSIIVLIQRVRLEIMVKQAARALTTDGRMADYLKQSLSEPAVIKELRVFRALSYMTEQWFGRASTYEITRNNYRRREGRMAAWFGLAFLLLLFASLAIMLGQLDRHAVTVGTVAIVFQTILQAQEIPLQMSWSLGRLYVQGAMAADLTDFLNEPVNTPVQQQIVLKEPIHIIVFDQVSYRYPGSQTNVLQGLHATLRAGETAALVGINGAGKSTFVKLMLGLFEPTEGRILINGHDMRNLDRSSLRRQLSAVFQDCGHYPLQLREYVTAGEASASTRTSPSDSDIRQMLASCGLRALSEGDNALDLKLTDAWPDGRELSGGQWQRLAISRAALRSSQVIALDEPTSAVDPSGELELYSMCKSLFRGKLAVFVSHRLGWARYADRILVLHDGTIAEDGSHEELIQQNGLYAEAFRAQAAWYKPTSEQQPDAAAI
ncbi:HlyB/MsbA family ABC transporter [Paenibacillus sp. CCS19]|uniref:ABC transporter ATP-binding protein n=1 Tax=Paenibacillus sp. CCS19 TaxID=3158387 RepID=UPI00255F5257|nr:ABC transporter ATP-binding protein [Paenibacillus cellulosilyticus]GMK37870.1 HlyB/MsbA family ABC transporter [Paenibacillus cellulosilyticus]